MLERLDQVARFLQGPDGGWAVASLILGCIVLLVLGPIFTLVHELGHACLLLRRSEGLVIVRVGGSRLVFRVRIGRLGA